MSDDFFIGSHGRLVTVAQGDLLQCWMCGRVGTRNFRESDSGQHFQCATSPACSRRMRQNQREGRHADGSPWKKQR